MLLLRENVKTDFQSFVSSLACTVQELSGYHRSHMRHQVDVTFLECAMKHFLFHASSVVRAGASGEAHVGSEQWSIGEAPIGRH